MYATCLFCHADLGRNDQLETFPAGKRLAFDAAKGRLWVICPSCKRWNLTPLEERWEAIETCQVLAERLQPVASSDRISLFRHASGLTLVHLGGATWRETAFWRYGARMTHRKTVWRLKSYGTIAATQVAPRVLGATALSALGPLGWIVGAAGISAMIQAGKWQALRRPVMTIGVDDERTAAIRRRHLAKARVVPLRNPGSLGLLVDSDAGHVTLEGPEAVRALGHALVLANAKGAAQEDLRAAVRRVEDAGSAERYLSAIVNGVSSGRHPFSLVLESRAPFLGEVRAIPENARLALEIAAHEEIERLALEGELAALEAMWKDAEEIAAISDNLLVPESVQRAWERLRGRGASEITP